MGNEALMLGGAVRSTVSDGSAAWYNPAGLATIERRTLMANINAFTYRSQLIERGIGVEGGSGADIRVSNVNALPGSLAFGSSLSDRVSIGFGLFVTRADAISTGLTLAQQLDDVAYEFSATFDGRSQDYNAVLGIGFRPNDRSRYGATLVLRYARQARTTVLWNALQATGLDAVAGTSVQEQLTQSGIGLILGGQWDLSEIVTLSAVVATPILTVADTLRLLETNGSGFSVPGDGGTTLRVQQLRQLSSDGRFAGPTRMHLGLAVQPGPWTFAIDAEARIEPQINGPGVAPTWNLRAGLQVDVSDRVSVGGGFFTDRTQAYELRNFGDELLQFVGGSLGLRVSNFIRLDPDERAPQIVRSTILGVRYAGAAGSYGALTINLDDNDVRTTRTRNRVHDVSLYLGAEFAF